jgi:drug/metabolite transporter (DMT)-like permease
MLILKVKLTRGQWIGIAIVLLALIMVGASSELRGIYDPGSSKGDNNATSAQVLLGIILILLGSLMNSIQGVFEEKLLKGRGYAEVDPLEVQSRFNSNHVA